MRGHNKNNILTLMLGLLVGVGVAVCGYAAPKVGPLDGKRVESLPALATPLGMAEEKITDTGFAEAMEAAEDWASALYAWQQVAHDTPVWAQAEALHHIARAQQNLGYTHAAAQTYRRLLDAATSDDARAEVYFYLMQLADATEQPRVVTEVLALQTQTTAGKAWKNAALYHSVWAEAQAGAVTTTYELPKALELQARVKAMDADLSRRAAVAGRFGVLPGLGHAYLGRPQSAAAMLPVWALFGWAMLFAFRRRQWPYGFIWALAFFAIWVSGPAQARKLAETMNADTRMAALNSWEDVMPAAPTQAELTGEAATPSAPVPTPQITEIFGPADVSPEVILASATAAAAAAAAVENVSTTVVQPSSTLQVNMRDDGKLEAVVVSATETAAPKPEEKKPVEKPKASAPPKPKQTKTKTAPVGTGAPAAWVEEPSPTSYFNIRPAN